MDKIDVAIIGGGVIGIAVAAVIAKKDRNIFIFERNRSFGQEISSRNSEVIHSGIYYPKDSLKTRTCVEGNRMLYEICRKKGVPCNRIGKLIVARDKGEIEELEDLFNNGSENGLEGLEMLSEKDVKDLEPHIKAIQAIYLPMTGIIDSHSLMEYFLSEAKDGGADIVYNSEVIGINASAGGYGITIRGDEGASYVFNARIIINCAGLDSDTISEMTGIVNGGYKLSYCKGDYFRVGNGKNRLVKRLVYPVCRQDDSSLGIHVTPDLAGGVRLGPDAEYLDSRELDYDIDPAKRDVFYESVKSFFPVLDKEDLSIDTSGIRPKLQGPGESFRDFVIQHESDSGFDGFINLIGIESPGLTASSAIARRVKKIVDVLI